MALNARSKRRSAFGKNPQAKMTAEEYHELIGKHKHIEHKALRQEVAKEFEAISQNRKSSTTVIQSGQNIFNPSQPPILPMEENEARNQKFVRSQTWPKLSTIQRCAHMLYYTLEPDLARKFLEKKKIPQAKIDAAYQVFELMVQSTNYWRKLQAAENDGRKYIARYNSVTRKYALQKAPWTLQLAMTLTDFHLDHIVDIVYLKPLWSLDYDNECEKRQQQQHIIKAPEWAEQEETESENDSEEQPIAELISKQKQRENEAKMQQELEENVDYVNKVADHMSREQLDAIKEKCQKQMGTSLNDLFGSMFKDMPNQGNIAFASNFEVNLDEDGDSQTEEIADTESEYEEEEVVSDANQLDPKLRQLYDKYPNLDQNLILQAFTQTNEDYDATVFQLDCIADDSVTNQFHESQSGK